MEYDLYLVAILAISTSFIYSSTAERPDEASVDFTRIEYNCL